MSALFYTEKELSSVVQIPPDEAKHLIKVLRHDKGDEIFFTDGKGTLYTAVLEETNYEFCLARIIRKSDGHGRRDFRLHIAIAPTKNTDRLEWFLEKATEIGVDEITPIICRRSERRELKTDRLQKILIGAIKQSFQTYLPRLNEPTEFTAILSKSADQRFIAHLEKTNPQQLKDVCQKGKEVLILIGPEGDFHADELVAAKTAGFVPTAMGFTRLRTETAGVMASAILSMINQ